LGNKFVRSFKINELRRSFSSIVHFLNLPKGASQKKNVMNLFHTMLLILFIQLTSKTLIHNNNKK